MGLGFVVVVVVVVVVIAVVVVVVVVVAVSFFVVSFLVVVVLFFSDRTRLFIVCLQIMLWFCGRATPDEHTHLERDLILHVLMRCIGFLIKITMLPQAISVDHHSRCKSHFTR